ncbi:MAG: hypothetical protein WBW84_23795 [Acidobacteriaceae bacterium]
MNLGPVEKIAEAVLYEGYMLYPYRPSSVKNQQRWNFGVLGPPGWCARQEGSESATMQTECLVRAGAETRLTVKIRFLQIVERTIGKLRVAGHDIPDGSEPEFDPVDRLEVAGRVFRPWREAVEREHVFAALDPRSLVSLSPARFAFPAGQQFEYLRDETGQAVGVIVRKWEALHGEAEFGVQACAEDLLKVMVRVNNRTGFDLPETANREDSLLFSLVSAHTILGVEDGEFISLLEPPEGLELAAAQCCNLGTWPVLTDDQAETMLSSPIVLYDHPQIAPESVGNLFDATEVDEILSLRILTLSDEEKREVRQSDDRAREILERTENLPPEQFMKLHGVLRGLTPVNEEAS